MKSLMTTMNCRSIIAMTLIFTGLLLSVKAETQGKVWTTTAEPLKEMELIRKQIKAPVFPAKDFLITKYGAVGDGKTLNTGAFKKAKHYPIVFGRWEGMELMNYSAQRRYTKKAG